MVEFEKFNKIARLSRNCVITEKIDGTNAQILITEEGEIFAGSRNRFITPDNDNYGFAKWVEANKEELLKLGEGRHFGEWWGTGIQRGYNMDKKVFSLFNTNRWAGNPDLPKCCSVVPILYKGNFGTNAVDAYLKALAKIGSSAAPGFMKPEGVVIFHAASRSLFKKTIENDEAPKSVVEGNNG